MRLCVCVCVPRAPHGGLSDTSALEISSGGGWVRIEFPPGPDPDRSPDFEKPCFRVLQPNLVCLEYVIIHIESYTLLVKSDKPVILSHWPFIITF